jgi:hypothetical protein
MSFMPPSLFLELQRYIGVLWSISDVLLVYFTLKFVNLIRKQNNLKEYKKLFYLLLFSFLLTPFLLFVPNIQVFIFIEVFVVTVQYLILVYVIIKDYNIIIEWFKNIASR